MDRYHPEVLPTDEQDRRRWLRHWLPGVPAKVVRAIRDEAKDRWSLTDRQVDKLLALFVALEIEREPRTEYRRLDSKRLRRWVRAVLLIDVKLEPGKPAVLRDPGADYRVEIVWLGARRKRGVPVLDPKSIRVVADGVLGFDVPDLQAYLAAFLVKVAGLPEEREFVRRALLRPKPGQPVETDFYVSLLAERDRLVAAGERAPAKVLGELLDENPITVRSQLRRGAAYLKDHKGGERR